MSTNADVYFNDLHEKAATLQSLIEVITDRVTDRSDPDRDYVADNLLALARQHARELTPMTLEDPDHWRAQR